MSAGNSLLGANFYQTHPTFDFNEFIFVEIVICGASDESSDASSV